MKNSPHRIPQQPTPKNNWKSKIHPAAIVLGAVLLMSSLGLEVSGMLPLGTTIALTQPVTAMIDSTKKLSEKDNNNDVNL
ncbi:hypothetical protein NIES4103_15730 [Nostoc sp. NIES-4103]|nr:hypothetical protein NIES4103_15730 [Nostoc sp. NIES-4103]